MVTTNPMPAPTPIVPRSGKKMKLLDIDPLELARQLTIMESRMYQRIKPIGALQRAREQRMDVIDDIGIVIQTSNRVRMVTLSQNTILTFNLRSRIGSHTQS